MNKALVKEDQPAKDLWIQRDPMADIPAGAKNYMTPQGARAMREEYDRLVHRERPRLLGQITSESQSDGSRISHVEATEARKDLRRVESRIEFLNGRLAITEVIDPASQAGDMVRFGATVTVESGSGIESACTIVGIDEADIHRGRISWTSPLARSLLDHEPGDRITIRTPKGVERVEITGVVYRDLSG